MSIASTTPELKASSRLPVRGGQASQTPRDGLGAIVASAVAAVLGALPHVLHHVGQLAGVALLAGTAGTLLFGAIGLISAIPFLLRVHWRCGNWRVPAALLATFAVMFSISALVIGPAISGGDSNRAGTSTPAEQTAPGAPAKTGHDAHH